MERNDGRKDSIINLDVEKWTRICRHWIGHRNLSCEKIQDSISYYALTSQKIAIIISMNHTLCTPYGCIELIIKNKLQQWNVGKNGNLSKIPWLDLLLELDSTSHYLNSQWLNAWGSVVSTSHFIATRKQNVEKCLTFLTHTAWSYTPV